MVPELKLRRARARDLAELREMHALSVRRLCPHVYAPRQIEAIIAHGTMDDVLAADGAYFVAEAEGRLVGSGGWSLRTPGYARAAGGAVPPPAPGEATIRSVFVHPDWSRMGVATALMAAAERDARGGGAEIATLAATLSGLELYLKLGYRRTACFQLAFESGVGVPVAHMRKRLAPPQPAFARAQ
jgi:GNAT superfamily N-acetyltransferase